MEANAHKFVDWRMEGKTADAFIQEAGEWLDRELQKIASVNGIVRVLTGSLRVRDSASILAVEVSMKSHVTMEQQKCLVCTRDFDTGTILLDTKLRQRFEHTTLTGWGLCPEHDKLYKDGYIALVVVDEAKSEHEPNGSIKPDGAYRTGDVAHLRFGVFDQVFSVPRGDHPVMFCDPAVIDKLKGVMEK